MSSFPLYALTAVIALSSLTPVTSKIDRGGRAYKPIESQRQVTDDSGPIVVTVSASGAQLRSIYGSGPILSIEALSATLGRSTVR